VNDTQRVGVEIGQRYLPIVPTPALARRALPGAAVSIDVPLSLATIAHPKRGHARNQTHRIDLPNDNSPVSVRSFGCCVHAYRAPGEVYPFLGLRRNRRIVALRLN
jgi:hypothetical protein